MYCERLQHSDFRYHTSTSDSVYNVDILHLIDAINEYFGLLVRDCVQGDALPVTHHHHHALLNSKTKCYCLHRCKNRKSGLVTSYTLISVFKELSSDKITIIVFHGY